MVYFNETNKYFNGTNKFNKKTDEIGRASCRERV